MKIKNKGKVYPSPSSSSSSSSSLSFTPSVAANGADRDVFSVLKLLPAAILALASVLSLEDREVLAYMITRSIKTTTTNPSSLIQDNKKKSSRKQPNNANAANKNGSHKGSPIFDCDCFDCYTSYWFRWDSSSNRELIHQAIEAFEDHLTNGEQSRKNTRGKKRDKTARRVGDKPVLDASAQPEMLVLENPPPETYESSVAVVSPDDEVFPAVSEPEKAADGEAGETVKAAEQLLARTPSDATVETEDTVAVVHSPTAVGADHKGLVRKVLPDVLGLLNSRLWNLWSPNV